MTNEQWRPIPGADGYEASSEGRVRSVERTLSDGRHWNGRVLRLRTNAQGYKQVSLSLGGKGKYRTDPVHILIAEAFCGPKPSADHQVAHFDGCRSNNKAANLRWATPLENAGDRDRHGTTYHPRGTLHGGAKLTEEMVRNLRSLRASGTASINDLVRISGVSRWTIFDALSGRTWNHI